MSRRDADAFQGGCRTRQRLIATCASASGLGWGDGCSCPCFWTGWACAVGFTLRAPISPTSPAQLHSPLSPQPRMSPTTPGPAAPYDSDPAASAAIAATMDKLDWPALLRRVDEGFCTWRQPSLLLFGTSGARCCGSCCCSGHRVALAAAAWHLGCVLLSPGRCSGQWLAALAAAVWYLGWGALPPARCWVRFRSGPPLPSHVPNKRWRFVLCAAADQFIELKSVFEWLESKRTCMKLASAVEAKLGHSPQVRMGGWRF